MITGLDSLRFPDREHPRALFLPIVFLLGAIFIQIKMAWQLGFFFEQPSATPGIEPQLFTLVPPTADKSLLLNLLSKLLSDGYIGVEAWHGVAMLFHYVNVFLFYLFVHKKLRFGLSTSLLSTALVGINPLGTEALAWGCCGNLLLTLTWTLLALLTFSEKSQAEPFWQVGLRAAALALYQILAFLTWHWGLLLFPALLIIVMTFYEPWREWGPKRKAILQITPIAIIWIAGSMLIISLGALGQDWENPPLLVLKKLIVSPLYGLIPAMNHNFLQSLWGIVAFLTLYAILLYQAIQYRVSFGLLLTFFLFSLPWAINHEPEARFFYISLPFLYFNVILLKKEFPLKGLTSFILFVFLGLQFFWMIDRIQLWDIANRQIKVIERNVQEVAMANPDKRIKVFNVPTHFGPRSRAFPIAFRCYAQGHKVPGAIFLPPCRQIAPMPSGDIVLEVVQPDWHTVDVQERKPHAGRSK